MRAQELEVVWQTTPYTERGSRRAHVRPWHHFIRILQTNTREVIILGSHEWIERKFSRSVLLGILGIATAYPVVIARWSRVGFGSAGLR